MANNCKVDFMIKEIRITKSFYKKAQIVGTKEFNTMIALQEKLPTFNIVFQNHPKPYNDTWYPTYSQMIEYIRFVTKDDENAMSELYDTIKLARITGKGYNMVRRWFQEKYSSAFEMAKLPEDYEVA